MNVIKSWPATVAGAVLTVLILILLFAAGSGTDTVKWPLWIVAILPVAIGVGIDLFRQGKLKAPSA